MKARLFGVLVNRTFWTLFLAVRLIINTISAFYISTLLIRKSGTVLFAQDAHRKEIRFIMSYTIVHALLTDLFVK